mmetsp:Transcript_39032/g.67567  ORF Transcript_39032/g.67567 Transcript_39032/m.67567 type:complete len:455 (-) Transcript_39032:886-2250(-)
MNRARAGFKSIRRRGTMQIHRHKGVNNLSFLGPTGLGQVARRDHVDHQSVPLSGLRHTVVDHVVRLEYVAGRTVLQKLAEVNVVREVSGLVVQCDQLVACRPGAHRHVVGRINTRALGVDTTQVVLVVVDPASHFIGQLNGFDRLNLCVRSHHVGGDGVTDCCGEGLHLASTQVGDVRQVRVSLVAASFLLLGRILGSLLGGALQTRILCFLVVIFGVISILRLGPVRRQALSLDKHLVLELHRRRQGSNERAVGIAQRHGELVLEDVDHNLGQYLLLLEAAVVLDTEHHGVRTGHETVLRNRANHISEKNLSRHGVSVADDRLAVVAIPAIQLHAAAAQQQVVHVAVHRGETRQLVALQVSIVGTRHVVIGQRMRHVLVFHHLGLVEETCLGEVGQHIAEHRVADQELIPTGDIVGGVEIVAVACCAGALFRGFALRSAGVTELNQIAGILQR